MKGWSSEQREEFRVHQGRCSYRNKVSWAVAVLDVRILV